MQRGFLSKGAVLRDDFVVSPASDPENGIFMGPPNRLGSHNGEIPQDYKSVRISGSKPRVMPQEGSGMHLGLVAPKDVLRGGRIMLCHARVVQYHRHMVGYLEE
jgi:hypothetical protein